MTKANTSIDYERFFNSLPNPYIAFLPNDPEFTIVAENEAHAAAAFSKAADAIGKPVFDVFPDNSEKYQTTGVSDLLESFRKVIRTGKPDEMPILNYDLKDGSGKLVEKWWRVTHYPVFDDSGELVLFYQATEDITEQILNAQQLELTKSQLDDALAVGLVSTWSWEIAEDRVIGDINLARSFGVSENEAKRGLPLQAFIDSIFVDDRERVTKAIAEAVQQNKTYNIDYRTVQGDGLIRWVIARGKVIHNADGLATHFSGILVDITDRKQAEAKLAEVQSGFSALFDSNVVAIARVTTKGHITQANDTFLKLFGYTKHDLQKGISSAQVSFIDNDPVTAKIYAMLQNSGEAEPVLKEYKRKDGSRFTGLVGAAMLPENDQEFMAFILDVTETEKLKELNVIKNEFIAMASHQLRTPVSTVKQYLGILIDEYAGELNEDQLQYANIANNANNRQIEIIEDLLKTAQIDATGYVLSLSTIDLVKLTQSVVKEYIPVVESKKQSIEFKHDKPIMTARVDKAELTTCIANLIENASKYSEPGKAIKVAVHHTKKATLLSVTDQGVGVDPKDYDKIFEKFTRVNNALSDTVTGNGLGLYWVKRIVDLHDGTIDIKSELGKGTTISIRLPYESR